MANYVSVTWTSGDIITEAKLDNMVSNDQAEDAHPSFLLTEISEPTTPAANKLALFVADASSITKLKIKDPDGNVFFVDTINEVALTDAGPVVVDWSDGPFQRVTATTARTFTFSNPQAGGRYILAVKNSGGTWTHTWPAAVKWPDDSAPVGSVDTDLDLYGFVYHGNESKYLGFSSLAYNV